MRFLLFPILWFILHMICVYICHKAPDRFYNPGFNLFTIKSYEKNGKIYEDRFKIKAWKNILPDGGSINSYGFEKRRIANRSVAYFEKFIIETKRAELIHWTGILTSTIFLLIYDFPLNILIYLIAIIIDIPFIMIQRYNRPRLIRLVQRERRSNET